MKVRYRKGVGGITGWYFGTREVGFTAIWNEGLDCSFESVSRETQEEIEKALEKVTDNSIWDDSPFDIKEYITMQALSIAYATLDGIGPMTLKNIERELFEVMKRLKIYDDKITQMRARCNG